MPLETCTPQRTARPDGPSRLSPLHFWRLRKRGKAWRLAEGLDVEDRSNVFHDFVCIPQGGVHTIEKATEVLSGGYPEHALDLALWTPRELIPPLPGVPCRAVSIWSRPWTAAVCLNSWRYRERRLSARQRWRRRLLMRCLRWSGSVLRLVS
jgi:hypothetical protein